MDGDPSPPRLVRFGAFEFDRHTLELRKHGVKIRLSGQPIEVLAMLMAHPGELVTREELQKRLWPHDTVVEFEHSINAAVKTLRRALDDSADEPRYIETLPRRAYRFIAPVETVAATLSRLPSAARTPPLAGEPPPGARRVRSVFSLDGADNLIDALPATRRGLPLLTVHPGTPAPF
jgi:DNA-binding winged helix-turn-helix (wHTH) protein